MTKDYEYVFNKFGVTNEEEKTIIIDFIETLYKTTIEIINNKEGQNDRL